MLKPMARTILTFILLGSFFPVQLACKSQGQSPNDELRTRMRKGLEQEQRPIHLYGIVLDHENRPVEGAEVRLQMASWYMPTLALGVSDLWVKTNGKGEFSLTGAVGTSISVEEIKKSGYEYSRRQEVETFFDFNRSNTVLPDQQHPIILRVRKKGEVTIVVGNGFAHRYEVKYPDSMAMVGFDVIKGIEIQGKDMDKEFCDLKVKATVDPRTQTWTVTLVPGNPTGGILASDQLLYVAPAEGYQPSWTFTVNHLKPVKGERIFFEGKYLYLRSREPALYTRLHVGEIEKGHVSESEIGLGVGSVTNPYGDRNLEEATELPVHVSVQLDNEVRSAFERGGRPQKPDLPRLVQEWEASRPLKDKVKGWLKR